MGPGRRPGRFVPLARILDTVVIVGTDVHSYDAFARPPYPSQIPPMRSPHESLVSPHSSTPIYDALYAEWRRLFRGVPFDRSGEENLQAHLVFRGWPPADGHRPVPQGSGRHREPGPAALPPGPSAAHNRLHGL